MSAADPTDRTAAPPVSIPKPIDIHVHVVGNGTGGTGCWLRVRGGHRPLASLMLRHVGLAPGAMAAGFDRLFIERLLYQVFTSSLCAGGVLPQDPVFNDQGG